MSLGKYDQAIPVYPRTSLRGYRMYIFVCRSSFHGPFPSLYNTELYLTLRKFQQTTKQKPHVLNYPTTPYRTPNSSPSVSVLVSTITHSLFVSLLYWFTHIHVCSGFRVMRRNQGRYYYILVRHGGSALLISLI